MALQLNVNSYVSLVEATAYFADRANADAWNTADDPARSRALVTATMMLDEMHWAGVAFGDDQPLAFPRVMEFFDPKAGAVLYLDGTTVPDRVKRAQYELAYHLLVNTDVLDSTASMGSLAVGPINLSNMQKAPRVPMSVNGMIKPLLANGGSTAWWRAN